MLKYLSDELREQRARLLARAAPLEADVGATFCHRGCSAARRRACVAS